MKCYECNKVELKKAFVEYKQYGVPLGKFEAEVCRKCGEIFYSSDSAGKIEKEAKKKGLFGLGAKTRIGTSGTALDVKLPKALVNFFKLEKGQEVIIEPIDLNRFQVTIETR